MARGRNTARARVARRTGATPVLPPLPHRAEKTPIHTRPPLLAVWPDALQDWISRKPEYAARAPESAPHCTCQRADPPTCIVFCGTAGRTTPSIRGCRKARRLRRRRKAGRFCRATARGSIPHFRVSTLLPPAPGTAMRTGPGLVVLVTWLIVVVGGSCSFVGAAGS